LRGVGMALRADDQAHPDCTFRGLGWFSRHGNTPY
jgi:hypothetical protein